jgi:hypothetical protein
MAQQLEKVGVTPEQARGMDIVAVYLKLSEVRGLLRYSDFIEPDPLRRLRSDEAVLAEAYDMKGGDSALNSYKTA